MKYAGSHGRLFIGDTDGCVWSDELKAFVPIDPKASEPVEMEVVDWKIEPSGDDE